MALLAQLCFHLSTLADKCLKGPLAMQYCLMYANCVKRGHQLELEVSTRLCIYHEDGKPVNCMYWRHPSWMLLTGFTQTQLTTWMHMMCPMECCSCDHRASQSVYLQSYANLNAWVCVYFGVFRVGLLEKNHNPDWSKVDQHRRTGLHTALKESSGLASMCVIIKKLVYFEFRSQKDDGWNMSL